MSVSIGDEAPDFELPDQDRAPVRLSSFRGEKAVAVVFYPFSFTGVCEGELCELRDDVAVYEAQDVQILAIACDSTAVLKQWAEQKGWTFPVLSDFWPHGEAARAYGVFDEALGCATRGTFLVDKDGKVADMFASEGLGTPREKSRYTDAVAKLA